MSRYPIQPISLEKVRTYPWLGEFRVFSHEGVGNTVAILLAPSAWMYEGLEAWGIESNPLPAHDHEFYGGRKDYPRQLEGAYHAVKLPILEYLERERRQAGAVAFLEVHREWIPLGVWRFRELARAALAKPPEKLPTLPEALAAMGRRVRVRLRNWTRQSVVIPYLKDQRRIEQYA